MTVSPVSGFSPPTQVVAPDKSVEMPTFFSRRALTFHFLALLFNLVLKTENLELSCPPEVP